MDNSCCFICKSSKFLEKNKFNFTCNHIFCVNCLYYLIFQNHINELNVEKILVKCKCKEGSLEMTLDNIYDIFNLKYNLNESDKEIESCEIHPNEEKHLFCKNCQKYVCPECSKLSEHSKHAVIEYREYVNSFKKFLDGIPLEYHSLKDFTTMFDSSIKKFYNEVENTINNTVKTINDVIESLKKLKIEYIKQIKEKYSDSIKLFKAIKMFYSDFYCEYTNRKTITDIFKLKFLKDIKYELKKIETILNPEFFTFLSSMKKQSLDLIDLISQILSYKFEFKEVSRGFVNVDKIYGHKKAIYCAIQLKDGRICTGSGDYTIRIWEEKKGFFKNTVTIGESYGEVVTLFQSRDGRLFSSTKGHNTIRVYKKKINNNNQEIYECESTLSDHSDTITWMIQLRDGRLITSSRDKSIKVWEIINNTFSCEQTLLEHEDDVYCVEDILNKRIASASGDRTIRIWREKEKKFSCTYIINGHTNKVRSVALMKDGKLISTGSDCTIKVWEEKGEKFKCVQSFIAHRKLVNSVIVLKDGRIVSASADSTVRVWVNGPKGLIKSEVLRDHKKIVMGVLELNDGRLVSYDSDSIGYIWRNGFMFD